MQILINRIPRGSPLKDLVVLARQSGLSFSIFLPKQFKDLEVDTYQKEMKP